MLLFFFKLKTCRVARDSLELLIPNLHLLSVGITGRHFRSIFFGDGGWSQGFMNTTQIFYQLSYTPALFWFWSRISMYPWLSWLWVHAVPSLPLKCWGYKCRTPCLARNMPLKRGRSALNLNFSVQVLCFYTSYLLLYFYIICMCSHTHWLLLSLLLTDILELFLLVFKDTSQKDLLNFTGTIPVMYQGKSRSWGNVGLLSSIP